MESQVEQVTAALPDAGAFKMWTYGAKRNSQLLMFRRMTVTEAQALRYGGHIWFVATDGTARLCKVNGAVKRWKRQPERFRVPVKYGMYECSHFENADLPRMLAVVTA